MSNNKSEYWCKTWDRLFWTFIDDYKDILRKQYRLTILIRNFENMDNNKKINYKKMLMIFSIILAKYI